MSALAWVFIAIAIVGVMLSGLYAYRKWAHDNTK